MIEEGYFQGAGGFLPFRGSRTKEGYTIELAPGMKISKIVTEEACGKCPYWTDRVKNRGTDGELAISCSGYNYVEESDLIQATLVLGSEVKNAPPDFLADLANLFEALSSCGFNPVKYVSE